MIQSDHWNYTINEWQSPEFFALLKEAFTQDPKVVFDVGACVGGWSEVVYRHFGVSTYAFEPFPANFEALESHVDDTHALSFPIGIYYGKRTAKAMWRGSNVGAIFVDEVDTTMAVDTYETFHLRTLEELDLPKPDLIKLDVEGAEKNIIEQSTLLRTTPQLIVEWHYQGQEDAAVFFAKHLPHKIICNLHDTMYLLRL